MYKSLTSAASGFHIGQARVYSFNASDAPYSGASTSFDLSLYDIQTFTILKCSFISDSYVTGTRVRGLNSGAVGYLAKSKGTTGVNELALSQTTGTFIVGEQLILNERTSSVPPSVKAIIAYTTDDIKSIRQDTF